MPHVFELATMSAIDRYKLLCGIVVPRPIALVTSFNAAGKVNAAPFSFFNVFSEDPPQIVRKTQRTISHMPASSWSTWLTNRWHRP